MELIRGRHNFDPARRGCVVTIGNFDGVHLGHQAVLNQLRDLSGATGLPSAVIVFEPQPQEFFRPDAAVARLSRWREKFALLRGYGVERFVCLRFDASLALLGAEEFVREILVDGLGARAVVIGDDFHFGRGRQGNFALLVDLGDRLGYRVHRASTYSVDGERVSSTRVRAALEDGDMNLACRLLGRHYAISGRVAHGNKRGREIGFPTANVELHRARCAVRGIYAARVAGLAADKLPAVAYVGTRPVINGTRSILEVHLLDYVGECYGRYVTVELIRRLREDRPFRDFESLREQIAHDVDHARGVLALPEPAVRAEN